MKKVSFFKQTRVVSTFALVAFLFGFVFLDQGITGNAIIYEAKPAINPVAVIGLVLVLCSAILGMYAVKNRSL